MFKKLDILDEKDKHLRAKSIDAELPLSKDEKKLVQQIIDHLTYSQIEEYEKKYDLRPGMGLAFPQIGINKRIIVIVHEYEDGKLLCNGYNTTVYYGDLKDEKKLKVVLKNDIDGVEIYEVKSSTEISEIYIHDISYQTWVLKQLGLNVKKS